jgi:hypothetical protein
MSLKDILNNGYSSIKKKKIQEESQNRGRIRRYLLKNLDISTSIHNNGELLYRIIILYPNYEYFMILCGYK